MKRTLCLLAIPLLLCGCIADQNTRQNQNPVVTQPGPVINVPPSEKVDTEEIKKEIVASANNTQNQLSGLVTTSISKLGEVVKGVEANLKDLVHLEANMTNTANAEFRAKLDAAITATATLNAEVNNMAEITSKIENHMTALTDIKVSLGKIDTRLDANLNAQVGIGNKLDNINSSAGRDVNMLPESAVKVMTTTAYIFAGIITTLCGLASTVISLAFRASRMREAERAKTERDERQRTYNLLIKALAYTPESKAKDIMNELHGKVPENV